jgi:hypothetical protein
MARRGGSRKSNTEQMVMTICGLRPKGDAVSVTVYRKGKSVRLFGPNGSHLVHPSNERTSDGWIREAILVWNLSEVYDEHPVHVDREDAQRRFAALRAKGDELQRVLAAAPKKDP